VCVCEVVVVQIEEMENSQATEIAVGKKVFERNVKADNRSIIKRGNSGLCK
jgi:hypothetical protein